MSWGTQTLLASALAWLILWIEHWFPWRMLLRSDLPSIARYVLGVLGFTAPLSLLFGGAFGETPDDGMQYLLAMWLVIVASGFSVVLAYVVDAGLVRLVQLHEAKEMLDERQRSSDD